MSLPEKIFNKLITKSSLSEKDCDQIAQKVVNEDLDSFQISSLLSFLFVRGESFNEIYSFVKILRNKMDKISLSNNLMDTCGTGGDNKNSFNLSTATSIALSACGIKIAKHGNRSITSKSGSFDVLESLGIQIDLNKSQTKKFFNRNGICFLFAPKYHSILKNFAHIRKSLQFRTIFNLLGPYIKSCRFEVPIIRGK